MTYSGMSKAMPFLTEMLLKGSANDVTHELEKLHQDKHLRHFIMILDEALELHIRDKVCKAQCRSDCCT